MISVCSTNSLNRYKNVIKQVFSQPSKSRSFAAELKYAYNNASDCVELLNNTTKKSVFELKSALGLEQGLAKLFDENGILTTQLPHKNKTVTIKQKWSYNERENTLKIVNAKTNKTVFKTNNANDYLKTLSILEQYNKKGVICNLHFQEYLTTCPSHQKLSVILESLKHINNTKLRNLLDRYKRNSRKFQPFYGCTSHLTAQRTLSNELEKTTIPLNISARRFEDWHFLDSIVLENNKTLGEEIRQMQAGSDKTSIKETLSRLGPVKNHNFLSVCLGKPNKYMKSLPVEYILHIKKGAKGVYIEDLISKSLSGIFESELVLQNGQFLKFNNITLKNKKVIIDADVL